MLEVAGWSVPRIFKVAAAGHVPAALSELLDLSLSTQDHVQYVAFPSSGGHKDLVILRDSAVDMRLLFSGPSLMTSADTASKRAHAARVLNATAHHARATRRIVLCYARTSTPAKAYYRAPDNRSARLDQATRPCSSPLIACIYPAASLESFKSSGDSHARCLLGGLGTAGQWGPSRLSS